MKMAPKAQAEELTLTEDHVTLTKASPRTYQIRYSKLIYVVYFHMAGVYGFYLVTTAMWPTIIFSCITFWATMTGIIAAAHRLWSHKSYKATQPLQVFLMLCQSMTSQYSAIHWARDHRLHHKFSDTDADPHNASRGLFFSHIGWLMVRKHPEVVKRGKKIDISDLTSNPVLMFQHRHGDWFIPLIALVVPTAIPVLWGETFNNAWHLNMARLILTFNLLFITNSLSHTWGYRPYDKGIAAAQNQILFLLTLGDGNHNFHHVFPWDYRSDEFGSMFNLMAIFIEGCAKLGLAYDLKTVPMEVIRDRMERTGDGSHPWVVQDSK